MPCHYAIRTCPDGTSSNTGPKRGTRGSLFGIVSPYTLEIVRTTIQPTRDSHACMPSARRTCSAVIPVKVGSVADHRAGRCHLILSVDNPGQPLDNDISDPWSHSIAILDCNVGCVELAVDIHQHAISLYSCHSPLMSSDRALNGSTHAHFRVPYRSLTAL